MGVGLSVWLLMSYGIVAVLQVLVRIGWLGMLAIVLFHVPQMLSSAMGWQRLAAAGDTHARLRTYLQLRWIREAVNNLLPLAQIGGEFVAARLLRRQGVALSAAIGSTVGDLMMEMATQVLFTVLGVALLVHVAGHGAVIEELVRGLLLAALLVVAAFVAFRLGLAALIETAVVRLGRSLGWPATSEISGLQPALAACFSSRRRVFASALWHLVSWLLGGVEVCLVLHFFGHDTGLARGLIIESLGQAAKAAGFAVPGAVGVQEGGYVLVGSMLGIAPELAIALSLVKRLREILLGIPGLILWHRMAGASGDHAVARG